MSNSPDHQSSISFSVGYAETLAGLSNAQMHMVLRAIVDDTPGLSRMVALTVRDQSLRELANLYGSAFSAKSVTDAYARYLSGVWLRERHTGPYEDASLDAVLLFKIAMSNGGRAIGYHQIRNILLGHRGSRI